MIYKRTWKYILTKDNFCEYHPHFYRLKAIKDFSDVKKESLGGYVYGYYNLSQTGNCWVSDMSKVLEDAFVRDNAMVIENSVIAGQASIRDNARISGDSYVSGDAQVYNNASVSGNSYISKNAKICENAQVLGNSKISGEDICISGNTIIKDEILTVGKYDL